MEDDERILRIFSQLAVKSLKEFGYPDITEEYVREQVDKILAEEAEDNVITLFLTDWLREAGLIQ